MTINERILEVMQAFKLNKNQFAKKLGVHATVVHNIVDENGRRNQPSFKFISKLISSFEDINGDWLLTGRGNILRFKEDTLNPLQEIEELKKDKAILAEQIILKDQQIQRLWEEIDELKGKSKG
jgi:predicted transcriptional regulator